MVTYEAVTLQVGSVVQILVARVDIGEVIISTMIPLYERSVVQNLVRFDI